MTAGKAETAAATLTPKEPFTWREMKHNVGYFFIMNMKQRVTHTAVM